jgi:hypothetical protein
VRRHEDTKRGCHRTECGFRRWKYQKKVCSVVCDVLAEPIEWSSESLVQGARDALGISRDKAKRANEKGVQDTR